MRSRLLWKIFALNTLVIVIGIAIVWLAIDHQASAYFMTLMKKYNIDPTEVNEMFLDATHRSLIWATVAACALALVVNLFLTRRILAPLSQMTAVTRRIAEGDYSVRLDVPSRDEVGALAAAFDQMAERLQRTETLRKTLIIDVAHELRTPLTNIRGYVEALRDGVVAPSRETFVSLHEETLRLASLVEDLLQLARAGAEPRSLQREDVQLRDSILEALEPFKSQLQEKGIRVRVELPSKDRCVHADREKLAKVFKNLVQNAAQYSPRNGYVRISAVPSDDGLKVVFANPGEGISEEDLPFIFEHFYRGEKSRSRELGGAGLGLAIVKEFVEAHGGPVGAESSPEETRVWLTLPARARSRDLGAPAE